MSDHVVPFAKQKIAQILEAGKAQLSEPEYRRLVELVTELQVHGITAYTNAELGKILSHLNWQLEISESPEWEEALIECDKAFLGEELKGFYRDMGYTPPRIGKKLMCQELYRMNVEPVVKVMEPFIKGEKSEVENE